MNNTDKQYMEIVANVIDKGTMKGDRTGTGTISFFGDQKRFNLEEGFPLLTTKKVHWQSVVGELLWFLRGDTNIRFLKDNKVKIWDAFADDFGEVGNMYGAKWRDYKSRTWVNAGFEGIDQVANLISEIKSNPNSRRLMVSAFDPSDMPDPQIPPAENVRRGKPALPPCHVLFQCYVVDGKLSLQFYQRSVDCFLGLPFNIASYALLTHMLAQVCGLGVGDLIWTGGDCHIYLDHIDGVRTQMDRFHRGEVYDLPTLALNPNVDSIDDFSFEDIELLGYKSGTAIKGKVSV